METQKQFLIDDGLFTRTNSFGLGSNNAVEFDPMDEALEEESCWFAAENLSNFCPSGFSLSNDSDSSSSYHFLSENKIDNLILNPSHIYFEDDKDTSNSRDSSPFDYSPDTKPAGNQSCNHQPNQTFNFLFEATGVSGIKGLLTQAIEYLKEHKRDRDVLIQIWMPEVRGGKGVLTTDNQPFFLTPNCTNLARYRDVSRKYLFAAEEDSGELVGLPTRVFSRKLPEWTADIQSSKKVEYWRVGHARELGIRGSLALPVFKIGSDSCVAVVEIVTIAQDINFYRELKNIYKALEAVDLRTREFLVPPETKDCGREDHPLSEIQEVLRYACNTHNLPLAQTWVPCAQQGKFGCGSCILVVPSASYVFDPLVLGFHEACCEQHLRKGEGIAGGAFSTNQACFASNVTALSVTEYPLSHRASLYGLRGAVAIRLRSIYTGPTDYILEFFLPSDCKEEEEQKEILSSLSSVIQELCRSLRVITDEELADGASSSSSTRIECTRSRTSWLSSVIDSQEEDKGCFFSLGCQKEDPEEEFRVTNCYDNPYTDFNQWIALSKPERQIQQEDKGSVGGQGGIYSAGSNQSLDAKKLIEKRLAKTEKNISLQLIQQYFPGSLKDAAKSIGVCPTTLKRICRKYGIARWPSRKIKKVGHTLRKLQLVIDSVQGVEGAIQLSSFYKNFAELKPPTLPSVSPFSSQMMDDQVKPPLKAEPQGSSLNHTTTQSNSCSGSQSSDSSLFSTEDKNLPVSNALSTEKTGGKLKRASSDSEMQDLNLEGTKFQVAEKPSLALPVEPKSESHGSSFRVKATFGEENIRLSLPQSWGLIGLQREIMSRFNIDDISSVSLRYLDDDSEWVLLTCDADLEECIDIHRSCRIRTIKLSVQQGFHPDLRSL